jgi:hypothetical protein
MKHSIELSKHKPYILYSKYTVKANGFWGFGVMGKHKVVLGDMPEILLR